ncbi:MAG: glycosyltransferase family 2 protein [Anaerolineales bacterium]
MNPDPLVSIVTPSFNQAQFLEETICSVLDQDYPNIEYIIMDGGSTDSSLEIIKKYQSKLAGWISEPDRGQTDAINKGFERASGEILAWINSDDTYQPGAVSEAVEYFKSHTGTGLVYGDANLIDEEGKIIGKFPARQTDYPRLRRGYVHIPQQSSFFSGNIWKRVGPLDPSFHFAMDYDLWVRIARVAPIMYVQRTWANFRIHSQGKTTLEDVRCWPEMVRVHKRDGGGWLSLLMLKAKLRPLIYAWLPQKMRIWIRQKNI